MKDYRLTRRSRLSDSKNRELQVKKKNTTGWRVLTRLTHPVTGIPRIKGKLDLLWEATDLSGHGQFYKVVSKLYWLSAQGQSNCNRTVGTIVF